MTRELRETSYEPHEVETNIDLTKELAEQQLRASLEMLQTVGERLDEINAATRERLGIPDGATVLPEKLSIALSFLEADDMEGLRDYISSQGGATTFFSGD